MVIKSISEKLKKIYDLLKSREEKCALKDIFPDLPGFNENQGGNAKQNSFLSELVLENLLLPSEPSSNELVFQGSIACVPEFLKIALCFTKLSSMLTIDCKITEDSSGEIVFSGSYKNLANYPIEVANVKFTMNEFTFSSGTSSKTKFLPKFIYNCNLALSNTSMEITIEQFLESKNLSILGKFDGLNISAISNIIEPFHISEIDLTKGLPSEISSNIFNNLELKEISINSTKEAIKLYKVNVISKNPISLFDNKISFSPNINIAVDLSKEETEVALVITGEFSIGSSTYVAHVNTKMNEIDIDLKKDSQLDVSSLSKEFFDVELPAIKFYNLTAHMNFHLKTYEFKLGVKDVLECNVAAKKISIDNVYFQVKYDSKNYNVHFIGNFDLCNIKFQVLGTYKKDGTYEFSSSITEKIKLLELLDDVFGESGSISDSFDFMVSELTFKYSKSEKEISFQFAIAAEFSGTDELLKKLFSVPVSVSVSAAKELNENWKYKISINTNAEIGESHEFICGYTYDSTSKEAANAISISYKAKEEEDVRTLEELLHEIGLTDIDESWHFITQVGISSAECKYDVIKKQVTGKVEIKSGGSVEFSITFGEKIDYSITISPSAEISFADIPIVGGITEKFPSAKDKFCVKGIKIYILSKSDEELEIPAGVRIDFVVLGQKESCQIYEAKNGSGESVAGRAVADNRTQNKIFWIKVDKNLAIFTLHRVGLGLKDENIEFVMDASLEVSPLQFDILEAGIDVEVSNFKPRFHFSGFGVGYESEMLTISGSLMKTGKTYAGSLLIATKPFSIVAIAEYSTDGTLFAYAVLLAQLGGIPEVYIRGLALGFGYNKRLLLPEMEDVQDYPLIQAAMGEKDASSLIENLKQYLRDEQGQKFLCFGIKFTTYAILNSFALITVQFGNDFEASLLGLSDITMPPNCPANVHPIAHAQLALKAQIKPSEGFAGVEARLTSESYILTEKCHLTGGFAFYMWYSGEHAGDFVVSLGGYHPKYELTKPKHYPEVPRVGFNWAVDSNINIEGGVYFAVTPSALMAGGRLSLTAGWGALKAWFIAKADFLINWKPFHYDAEIGITVGASYRLKVWFVHKTFKVELGADLHVWGPEFSAMAHIKWWIISFDVSFGADASQSVPNLNWNEFCESFLPKAEEHKSNIQSANAGNAASTNIIPLKTDIKDGLSGKFTENGNEIDAVASTGVKIAVESVIPIASADLNDNAVSFKAQDINIKPMGSGKQLNSNLSVVVTDQMGKKIPFDTEVIKRNVPSALWGGEQETRKDVPTGINLTSVLPQITLFPQKNCISLEDLYRKGTIEIYNAFIYMHPTDLPEYTDKNTIKTFSETVDSASIKAKRMEYLKDLGVEITEEISLTKYASLADSYLDEEVLVPIYG